MQAYATEIYEHKTIPSFACICKLKCSVKAATTELEGNYGSTTSFCHKTSLNYNFVQVHPNESDWI